jgi:hypothetical protein
MTLTICAFKWGTRYTLRHVSALYLALGRHLTIPHEFALISDDPDDESFCVKAGIRYIPLWDDMRGVKNCGVRLAAFHSIMSRYIAPRFAWLDLDVVITGNVDHIFSRPESFVGLKTPAPPMPFNGSLVIMDAGAYPAVRSEWTPERYEACGAYWLAQGCAGGGASDEGWIGRMLRNPNIPARGIGTVGGDPGVDGIYYFKRHLLKGRGLSLPADARMVVMNGRQFDPSLPEWQARAPWLLEHWRPAW